MSNSESFRSTTEAALQNAIQDFRALLEPASGWKPVAQPDLSALLAKANNKSGGGSKQQGNGIGQLSDVQVHKKHMEGGGPDIVRATADLAVSNEVDLRDFKAVLHNPEARVLWDRLVERASVLDTLNPSTQISKVDFKLGWPASPRDCILISRTFSDDLNTLIFIATSLPRSMAEYEPAFLRPNPPYVRSHVHLFAWCIHLPIQRPGKARITLFQRWNLKGAILSSTPLELTSLLTGLVDYTRSQGDTIPYLSSFGHHFTLANSTYKPSEEALVLEYAILPDEATASTSKKTQSSDSDAVEAECTLEELESRREAKRLERSAEVLLPAAHGWDISVKCQPASTVADDWFAVAQRSVPHSGSRILFRITHATPDNADALIKITLVFRRLAGGKSLRLNQQLLPVTDVDDRIPSSQQPQQIPAAFGGGGGASSALPHSTFLEDTASLAALHPHLQPDSVSTASSSTTTQTSPADPKLQAVAAQIRRSYTYFASLLQEPEAKWRHVAETRGVSVGQLDSPDRTVTIYRAIATFVGVGVWDLCSAVLTSGARKVWDKSVDEVKTIDDFGELSSLNYLKFKAIWPAWPRDSVLVRTVYKSPTSIHIFSFSIEDSDLLPLIPPTEPSTIRSDTVIQGWCIEALSPSTTQVTLIEQTNLKGWQTKGLVYQSMVNAVASAGDFTIKSGSPPFVNRLLGAQCTLSSYIHVKGSLKVEYAAKPNPSSLMMASPNSAAKENVSRPSEGGGSASFIECEIRCDTDTWGTTLDVVVDPPPSRVSCLARHRLAAGGGTWITLEHDAALVAHDVVAVNVRKGPASRAKGSVFVNGARIKVDNQAMAEAEIKSLTLEKRMRSSPVPLDQWPTSSRPPSALNSREPSPRVIKPSPLSVEGTDIADSQEVKGSSAETDASYKNTKSGKEQEAQQQTQEQKTTIKAATHSLSASPHAMHYALESLALLQALHVEQGPELSAIAPGWTSTPERGGLLRKKLFPSLSSAHPIMRGDKIVEGVTAEQLLGILVNPSLRPTWDERVENSTVLQSFGHGCTSALLTTKPAFLTFRGRLLHVAQVLSQVTVPSASNTSSTATVYLLASASAPLPEDVFPLSQTNPHGLPVGRVIFEGWILETLDPYSSDSLPIPSTRTSHFTCIDWSGSVPASFAPLLNVSPLKLIDALTQQARRKAVPRPLAPLGHCQIEGPLSNDEEGLCSWSLQSSEASVYQSKFLCSDMTPSREEYRVVVLLPNIDAAPSPVPAAAKKSSTHHRTPSNPFRRQAPATSTHHESSPSSNPQRQRSLKSLTEGEEASPPAPALRPKGSVASLKASMGDSALSTALPSKPSASRDATDLVVAELLVAYRDFCATGYELSISASPSNKISKPLREGEHETQAMFPPSFDETALTATTELPFRVSVHETQHLGVPTSADKVAKNMHLVRVTLPTSQFTNPVADPLRDAAGRAPPSWFRRLKATAILVAVDIRPLPGVSKETVSTAEKESKEPIKVLLNGNRVHISSEKESKSVLERHERSESQAAAPIISRPLNHLPPVAEASSTNLPESLSKPQAINGLFVPASGDSIEEDSVKSPVLSPRGPLSRQSSSEQVHPNGSSKAGSSEEQLTMHQQLLQKSTSLLGTYPISLAAGAFTGRVDPVRSNNGHNNSFDHNGQQSGPRRAFSLHFVIVVAIIAFLLGSFLRALLTPADFVLYASHSDKGTTASDVALLSALEARRWRAARRLFEIKLPGRDLIVASVRKNSA